MPRVLHLVKGLGPGGAEVLLVHQVRARSADLAMEVAYLLPWKHHLVPALQDAGAAVLALDVSRTWDPRWLWRLRRRLVASPRVDVLHGHSPLVASLTRLLVRTIGRDRRPLTVYTEHNVWDRHARPTRMLNRLTLRLEDAVLAVSDGVAASMRTTAPVRVLRHGIDTAAVREVVAASDRDAVREELGAAPEDVVIVTVANYRKEKAYDVLLDAAAIVVAECPMARFVSIGQGPLEAQIIAQHRRLGLGERFRLLGYQAEPVPFLAAADVFTLASRHEGLPVALMEAMAAGLPVAATAVGGVPEIVVPPDVLVPPDDVDALAAALVGMVRARPARRRPGTRPGELSVADAAVALRELYGSREETDR